MGEAVKLNSRERKLRSVQKQRDRSFRSRLPRKHFGHAALHPLTMFSAFSASYSCSICSSELLTRMSRSSGVFRFGLKSVKYATNAGHSPDETPPSLFVFHSSSLRTMA